MKVAFITRSTLHSSPGGDTVQVRETAKQLEAFHIKADIVPANARIRYQEYDLLHLFNIIRPADLLLHATNCGKPYVVTPILVNYTEYDKQVRKGISGWLFRHLSPAANEYIKTAARWLKGNDPLVSKAYLWKGHKKSMQEALQRAAYIIPNSSSEAKTLEQQFSGLPPIEVVPNGADTSLFKINTNVQREQDLVICAARIEGIKNQLNLIRALNDSTFRLVLIGAAAPNQKAYYRQCREIAGGKVQFIDHLPQQELLGFYQKAAVHILPSWFETCGLSSLEAAAAGCNIVVSDRGFTRDYFGNHAFYCNPADTASIAEAVQKAAAAVNDGLLTKKIQEEYTWQKAAEKTAAIYKKILQS